MARRSRPPGRGGARAGAAGRTGSRPPGRDTLWTVVRSNWAEFHPQSEGPRPPTARPPGRDTLWRVVRSNWAEFHPQSEGPAPADRPTARPRHALEGGASNWAEFHHKDSRSPIRAGPGETATARLDRNPQRPVPACPNRMPGRRRVSTMAACRARPRRPPSSSPSIEGRPSAADAEPVGRRGRPASWPALGLRGPGHDQRRLRRRRWAAWTDR